MNFDFEKAHTKLVQCKNTISVTPLSETPDEMVMLTMIATLLVQQNELLIEMVEQKKSVFANPFV